MRALYWKEINAFFGNLSGFLILAVFLISLGLIVWVFPDSSVLNYGFADLETMFLFTPYVFTFLIPAITMKMIAEERRSGTWELLRTSPLGTLQIVMAKYLSALTLIIIALLPTLVYYFSIVQLGDPVGNIDHAGFFGSWIGLLLMGAVFAAIGLFCSSWTSFQMVAFIGGVFLSFLLYFGLTALVQLQVMSHFALFLEELSLSFHFESMSRGVIVAENVAYFLSIIILMLGFTMIGIRRK
ncbi:gliding motility-associated ABC transporter permease subunit GldF [Belliella sp. DSM 111904]|uniref:Gliding motility-associated ABC transporter permease subunit GldF n=1 Tax=Belliella filtrata TaxID=2923435 RepID=A0ABS9V0V5_9BACT|nr:gliding motility-associated ABC transporter permease subunit GldF [Belliella filtrata]MCH7410032.1 gliding motility-associated ABC transporter permease subunit GldF [Belliella filtrata]